MLGVEAPKSWTHVVREVPYVTNICKERSLREMTHYNLFQAFPGRSFYISTCLSDSGTAITTDTMVGYN